MFSTSGLDCAVCICTRPGGSCQDLIGNFLQEIFPPTGKQIEPLEKLLISNKLSSCSREVAIILSRIVPCMLLISSKTSLALSLMSRAVA